MYVYNCTDLVISTTVQVWKHLHSVLLLDTSNK